MRKLLLKTDAVTKRYDKFKDKMSNAVDTAANDAARAFRFDIGLRGMVDAKHVPTKGPKPKSYPYEFTGKA